MFLKKILTTTMAVLALGVAVITGGSLAVGQTEGKQTVGKDVKVLIAEKPMKPAAKQQKEKPEPEVAWGKEVGGLRLGLVLVPADKTAFRPGETMEFIVKVRNVSKDEVAISYGRPESTPTITDATGEKVRVAMPPFLGIYVPVTDKALRPGETVDLYNRTVTVEEVRTREDEQKGYVRTPTIRVGAGKYKIAFPQVVTQNLVRSTGEVEFEVKGGDEKKLPEQKEAFTAWGKEVGGLQAGLGFKAGEKRTYHHGEKVTLVLRVRNVGKEEVKFSHYEQEFRESLLRVTHDGGKAVPLQAVAWTGRAKRTDVTLAPGKTVDLSEANLALRPVGDEGQKTPAWTLFGTGKYQLECEKAGGSIRDQSAPDSILSKLATGKLELEVKEPEKLPQDKKEALTAWGKEVGGLQAGLMCVPSDKKTFRHRETVTLVVRVRNVGKEVVKFQYLKQFLDETPLAVTDADGMPVPHPGGKAVEGEHAPVDVALKPGEEVVLESKTYGASGLPFEFVPLWSGVQTTTHRAVVAGPGKFGVQFERVLGNSSSGKMNLDPALEKLATGRLELEIGKLELPDAQPKPNAVAFTVKNATIDEVDEKAGVVSVSFGNKEKPTKLVSVPLDKGVRVVASHVLPGVANNLPFEWRHVERLKGKVVSVRLAQTADGLAVVSIASGND